MTLQDIKGSDYYSPVRWTASDHKFENWNDLQTVPGFGWEPVDQEINEAVCDVVPEYHAATGTVLAMGINIYYRNGKLYEPYTEFFNGDKRCLRRYPVYAIMDQNNEWVVKRKKLEFPEFYKCSIYTSNCSQRLTLPDGRIIIPVTFNYFGRHDRSATTLLCNYDGRELTVVHRGSTLTNPVGRGLLEPSIAEFRDRYYMTLRAEDDHGYVSVSDDGLNWQDIKPWQWEDGTPLTMSTTQQHWLELGGKLYLIYTRKNGVNGDVFRWRAPLLLAEFDQEKLCLKKTTEQTVFPMRLDPQNRRSVGLMGNFHPLAISKHEAIVTVGEMRPDSGFTGDTILARIKVD